MAYEYQPAKSMMFFVDILRKRRMGLTNRL